MVWFPIAKINLGLYVLRKRNDGFHDISTCFYPVTWKDIIEIIPSDKFSFTSSGLSIPGDQENNLCIKAYQLLKKDYNLPPVQFHLHKIIPIGAGLGGGSSDAAYTLKGLNELFNLGLDAEELQPYARQLGSDCSFFLYNQPVIASGKGDELEAIDLSLKGYKIVIIYPDIHVNTAAAYDSLTPSENRISLENILQQDVLTWKDKLVNDFENSILKKHPVIGTIKEKLYDAGAVYVSMSGSGSAVYALFSKVPYNLSKLFHEHSIFISEA